MRNPTPGEERAIQRLRDALKRWPKTLRLQAGTGGLNVALLDPETRDHYYLPGSNRWDHESIVANIEIDAEGGDPW